MKMAVVDMESNASIFLKFKSRHALRPKFKYCSGQEMCIVNVCIMEMLMLYPLWDWVEYVPFIYTGPDTPS